MKKYLSLIMLILLSVITLTGCDIKIEFNNNSNEKKEESGIIYEPIESGVNIINGSISSARARTVEGHIKNIEYAILEAAFKTGSGETDLINGEYSQSSLDAALSKVGVSLPTSDYIKCNYYKIDDGTVIKTSGCAESSWSNSYSYSQGKGAIEE